MTKIIKKTSPKREKFNPMKQVRENAKLMDKLTDELEEQGATIFKPVELTNGTLNIDNDYLSLPYRSTFKRIR